jgi:predicted dehydrogenase
MDPDPKPEARAAAPLPSFEISRRAFVKRCSMIAALTGLPLWFVERQQLAAADVPVPPSPNDRPGIALVGCGGMGTGDGINASNHGEILAVCDVDANHAAAAAKKFTVGGKVPTIYSDFRRVMERSDIHVILTATPDHWHTLVNLAAAKAGKDVYSEKPLTLTIDEGRHIVKAVHAGGIVLQTGTQQRSMQRFRLACELVRNGRIGTLNEANVWLPAGLSGGPFASVPVPPGLDWDFWQGQAPRHDYVPERCHVKFRYWYDYSAGTLTDWGAHHNDIAYWAIGLLAPREVEAKPLSKPVRGGYTAYAEYEVHYTYSNGVRLNIRTTKDDDIYGRSVNPKGQHNGIRFEGTQGWIWVNRDEIKASDPQLLRTPLPDNAVRLYESKDHMGNFFDCVRSRKLPICDVETGHRSATMCHLGAIALRTGNWLTWDSSAEQFVGHGARSANEYIVRPMRKPYDYSFVA